MNETLKKYQTSMYYIILLTIIYGLLLWRSPRQPVVADKAIENKPTEHIVYIYVLNLEEIETTDVEEKIETIVPVEEPKKVTREFEVTAYGNELKNPENWKGITANGFDLKGHTRETAMSIAADPKVLPLGSKVNLYFEEPYTHYDGTYTVRDTGGAVKGNIIDLFIGSGPVRREAIEFGRRKVQVEIIE